MSELLDFRTPIGTTLHSKGLGVEDCSDRFTPRERLLIHAAALELLERRVLDSTPEEWVAEAEADYEAAREMLDRFQSMSPSGLLALDYLANGTDHGMMMEPPC